MEKSLFDTSGCPVAYFTDDDDCPIYLWSGHAVAYVCDGSLYGWNGKHLGSFTDGVICDARGWRVGSTMERCWCAAHAEPAKPAKREKRQRYERRIPSPKPELSGRISDTPLQEFLAQGAVGTVTLG